MKTMPHNPDIESFACMREISSGILKQGKDEKESRLLDGDGAFFKKTGDQWFLQAMIDSFFEASAEKVVEKIRKGLADMRMAMELRHPFSAWEIRDHFLYAVAANDIDTARFICTMPEEIWHRSDAPTAHWLVQQNHAVFALYQEEKEAATLLKNVRAMTFDQELPVELKPDLPHIQNFVELLESVQKKEESAFENHLKKRMELRTDLYANGGECVPAALLDLQALGLCQMAKRRGMKWEIKHPYLQDEILDVPPLDSSP